MGERMAVERKKPTFDDIASIAASLTEEEGVVMVSNIPIKYNLRDGKAFPPEELKNDKVTQFFSVEVLQTYREPVEQAISIKVQLELLQKLRDKNVSGIDKGIDKKLDISTTRIKDIKEDIKDIFENIGKFGIFSREKILPTRQEEAVREILTEYGDIENIRSREHVDSIMKKLDERLASSKPGKSSK